MGKTNINNFDFNRIISTISDVQTTTYSRLEQKGYRKFIGSHEALGIITEEYYELIEAVKSDNIKSVKHELMDIAVACVLAIESLV